MRYSLRQGLVLRSTDYFNARRAAAIFLAVFEVVVKTEAITNRVIIVASVAFARRQHQLLVTLLVLTPVERVAIHGDFVEAKVVVNR